MPEYYRLLDLVDFPGRWHLNGVLDGAGHRVDARLFLRGGRVELVEPLRVSLRRSGTPMDFCFGDFDMPVARRSVAEDLAEVAMGDVQIVRCRIDGVDGEYVILHAAHALTCLDERNSGYVQRNEGLPAEELARRPYKSVISPSVLRGAANGHHFFRIAGWTVALIVSREAKSILSSASGAAFEPA